jgi:hypothetical protein
MGPSFPTLFICSLPPFSAQEAPNFDGGLQAKVSMLLFLCSPHNLYVHPTLTHLDEDKCDRLSKFTQKPQQSANFCLSPCKREWLLFAEGPY